MSQNFLVRQFPNGLTLLGERMPSVQSAAMSLLIPGGGAADPAGQSGSATVLSDWIFRGAGNRENRALAEHLDNLGLHRGCGVSSYGMRFSASAVAARLMEALPAYADVLRHAQLPDHEFERTRDLALQSLEGLQDDPNDQLRVLLRKVYLPDPIGRNPMGREEDLRAMTPAQCRRDYQNRFHAGGCILALAGDIDFEHVQDVVSELFGDWRGGPAVTFASDPLVPQMAHMTEESEQTYIGVAYPSIAEADADYYAMRLAYQVLSGGMGCRLFTELREKQGLCYSVSADHQPMPGRGAIMAYVGTTPQRAQKSLDELLQQINLMRQGVSDDEVERAKVQTKSAVIMQGDSSGSRAYGLGHDWFYRSRPRTLDEIKAAIDAVTTRQVNEFLSQHPPGPFTVASVGPEPLKMLL